MDSSTAPPWQQGIMFKPMEDIITTIQTTTTTNSPNHHQNKTAATNSTTTTKPAGQSSTSLDRKTRPQKDQPVNCPRCNSTNTKFCYYNNYSLTQPRYFCKGCRRYWTEGGTLRSIPVGGGSRKNRRSSSLSSTTTSSSSKIKMMPNLVMTQPPSHNASSHFPSSLTNPNDYSSSRSEASNLGFPTTLSEFMNLQTNNNKTNGADDHRHHQYLMNPYSSNSNSSTSSHISALEHIITMSGGFTPSTTTRPSSALMSNSNSFMAPVQISSDPNYYSSFPIGGGGGFPFQFGSDFRFRSNTTATPPTLSFSLDHGPTPADNNTNVRQEQQQQPPSSSERNMFSFEELKRTQTVVTPTTTGETTSTVLNGDDQHHYHHHHQANDRDHSHDDDQTEPISYWGGMLGGEVTGSW